MPLNFTAAHSSRVSKRPQGRNPLLKRSASTPFANAPRRKPISRAHSKPEETIHDDNDQEARLEDIGRVKTFPTDRPLADLTQIIQYAQAHMFDELPESGGFNSTRIAEILNFRKALPPTVTFNHLHALVSSATKLQREVSEMTRAGTVKQISIPGRGFGGSSLGESLALTQDIEELVRQKCEPETLGQKFLSDLRSANTIQALHSSAYTASEINTLVRAGYITTKSPFGANVGNAFSPKQISAGTQLSISSISRAASGSVAAVGGDDAFHKAGGRGGAPSSNDGKALMELQLSLPGMGQFLKLVLAAREHLLALLRKSRFHEVPLYLLRERWDGGIASDDGAAKAKKYRGEFAGVLPARTRKWKQFYGIRFDWVLAECVGAGLIELFETGSVGQAARIP